jgi:acyl carrier protein
MCQTVHDEPSRREHIEEQLTGVWKDLLQTENLTVSDDFSALGGDSLVAMSCISRVRRMFGVELSIEDFFLDNATIAGFARVIDQASREG